MSANLTDTNFKATNAHCTEAFCKAFCGSLTAELHWREFVDTDASPQRSMYAYHFQNASKNCLFRYDNASHRSALGFSDHKHCADGSIIPVQRPPTLEEVVSEVLRIVRS